MTAAQLEAEIFFQDGAGKTLFKIDLLSTNWGAGFQIKKGQIRDIAPRRQARVFGIEW